MGYAQLAFLPVAGWRLARRESASSTARAFVSRQPRAVSETRELVARIVAFRAYAVPPGDREDIVQEVMLQLWQAVEEPNFDLDRNFRGFIQVVAIRRCIDWTRTHKPTGGLPPHVAQREPGPLEQLVRDERIDVLREVLDRLGEGCRELIRLHVAEERTYGQIAELWGRSEGALRVQMFQCIRQARQILEDRRVAGA